MNIVDANRQIYALVYLITKKNKFQNKDTVLMIRIASAYHLWNYLVAQLQ